MTGYSSKENTSYDSACQSLGISSIAPNICKKRKTSRFATGPRTKCGKIPLSFFRNMFNKLNGLFDKYSHKNTLYGKYFAI